MTNIVDIQEARLQRVRAIMTAMMHSDDFPLTFSAAHCAAARERLGWSVEALAFRSGASISAIQALESGTQELRRVTMQALAFAFEKEGLIFFPGIEPMLGDNCRGGTVDPRTRQDYHLLE
ncbi:MULTISPECIES: helix-turn-helix domain-containing protein [Pseudomonas]|uniref:helix-turn-helix domain-containing protein n=1 Tax=Pseudomonas TaxID=286 RepID=UPI00352681A7